MSGSTCDRITTQAECVTAVTALNLKDRAITEGSTGARPQGCSCNAGGINCYFNNHASNQDCGYGQYNCICKSGKMQRIWNAYKLAQTLISVDTEVSVPVTYRAFNSIECNAAL